MIMIMIMIIMSRSFMGTLFSREFIFKYLTGWFPASRGLSRRGKMKRQKRDLCRLPTSFLSRMRSRFLNNQWRCCHVQHSFENRFEFEWERERLLNLSALKFQMDQSELRWNNLASGRCRGPHHTESLRKAEEANFKANISFFTSLPTAARVFGVKFIGLHGTVGLLRFGTFLFEEKAIWGLVTSCQRWTEFPCLSRRGKNQRFAVARRKTLKRMASFKETKYAFSL